MRATGESCRTICLSPRNSAPARARARPSRRARRRVPLKFLPGERPVDPEGRPGTLRGRDDRELNVLDDVAGDEYAGHVRGLVATAFDPATPVELATEGLGQPRLAGDGRIEEQRPSRQRRAVPEFDRAKCPSAGFEPGDANLADLDAVGPELVAMSARQRGLAIAAEHDVSRPRREGPCHFVAAPALSVRGDRLAAEFPSVAIRALEHALPEQRAGAGNRRQPVEYARCDQQLAA